MSIARSCCCCCPQRRRLDQFSPLLFSALTQFFQIFPEYQSNEFYATGEVRFHQLSFHLPCLFLSIINPLTCSPTQASTFLLFPTTSTKTTPLPKWRSTSLEWRLVTDSVIPKRFVLHQMLLAECSLSVLLRNIGKYVHFRCWVVMATSCTKRAWSMSSSGGTSSRRPTSGSHSSSSKSGWRPFG